MSKIIKIPNNFCRRLERIHNEYQLSYEHISKATGIESRTLYRIRMGTSQLIRVTNYQRLCRYFDEVESGVHPDSTRKQKISAITTSQSLCYLKKRLTSKMYKLLSQESGVGVSVIQGIMTDKIDSVNTLIWDALILCVNDGGSTKLKSRHKKIKAEKKPAISKAEFAAAFSSVMTQRGLDYKELADMIGVSCTAVRKYAIGENLPRKWVLIKIKEVLPEITSLLNLEKE